MSAHQENQGRLPFAVDIARAAGNLTLEYFHGNFDIEEKADGSVVTIADRSAEALLRERIEQTFPDDAILGEEHGTKLGKSGYRWVLDPIDGTFSFVHRVPLYGTLVAVEFEGEPIIGVIHMPALDEMVYAEIGGGCHHVVRGAAPTIARVTQTTRLDRATMLTTAIDYFAGTGGREQYLNLVASFGHTRGWSDCYAHVLAATGRADVVIEPYVNAWDVAPMLPILKEAGGRFTDFDGRERHDSGNGIASNGLLHDQVLAIVQAG